MTAINQQAQQTQQTVVQSPDDEINLMELLLVIVKHNRFIIKLTVFAAVLAVAVSLLLPNIYTGETVILPPQQASSTASMLLGQLGGLAGCAMGIKSPSDQYVGMLKSRTIGDALIQHFHLNNYYQAKTATEARLELTNATNVTSGKDGFITVQFSDKDPKLAADIANAYVDELDKLTQILAVTEAGKRRLFFERQLKAAKDALVNAENTLKQTQQKTGLIQLDKQAEAVIKAIAELRAQIATKEVELAAMRAFATDSNPDYRQLREVISGLKAQLSKVERDNVAGNGDIMIATAKLPELGLDYMRKVREVKYQETLFELLAKQYEIAKIDEAKDAAIIQVVDKAVTPERKSKPKRALIVILVTMLAFFMGILLAFLREATERSSQDPESAERMSLLRRYIRLGR